MKQQESKARPIKCVVTSDKMNKSRVGEFTRLVQHARYNKYIKRRTKVMFHDEKNATKIGDQVLVKPSKPYSTKKRFVLLEVLTKA